MIYIYKNGKRVRIGDIPLRIYLDSEGIVVATCFENLDGYDYDKLIEAPNNLSGALMSKSKGLDYYHKLKDGHNGKAIEDYEKIYDLQKLKNVKYDEIDFRTDELIAMGIPFDSNLFSTSPDAQRNWIALFSARNDLTYPISVTTLDEKAYIFNDSRIVSLFYLTGISVINYHIATGRALKLQVGECNTKECIDSIVDSR